MVPQVRGAAGPVLADEERVVALVGALQLQSVDVQVREVDDRREHLADKPLRRRVEEIQGQLGHRGLRGACVGGWLSWWLSNGNEPRPIARHGARLSRI